MTALRRAMGLVESDPAVSGDLEQAVALVRSALREASSAGLSAERRSALRAEVVALQGALRRSERLIEERARFEAGWAQQFWSWIEPQGYTRSGVHQVPSVHRYEIEG